VCPGSGSTSQTVFKFLIVIATYFFFLISFSSPAKNSTFFRHSVIEKKIKEKEDASNIQFLEVRNQGKLCLKEMFFHI